MAKETTAGGAEYSHWSLAWKIPLVMYIIAQLISLLLGERPAPPKKLENIETVVVNEGRARVLLFDPDHESFDLIVTNSPYQFKLVFNGHWDNPFTNYSAVNHPHLGNGIRTLHVMFEEGQHVRQNVIYLKRTRK